MTFTDTEQNPSFYTLARSLTPSPVEMTFSNGSGNAETFDLSSFALEIKFEVVCGLTRNRVTFVYSGVLKNEV